MVNSTFIIAFAAFTVYLYSTPLGVDYQLLSSTKC
nr:MAG TPA_asm: hypothetical protein [Caudoviricetes sp.]